MSDSWRTTDRLVIAYSCKWQNKRGVTVIPGALWSAELLV